MLLGAFQKPDMIPSFMSLLDQIPPSSATETSWQEAFTSSALVRFLPRAPAPSVPIDSKSIVAYFNKHPSTRSAFIKNIFDGYVPLRCPLMSLPSYASSFISRYVPHYLEPPPLPSFSIVGDISEAVFPDDVQQPWHRGVIIVALFSLVSDVCGPPDNLESLDGTLIPVTVEIDFTTGKIIYWLDAHPLLVCSAVIQPVHPPLGFRVFHITRA